MTMICETVVYLESCGGGGAGKFSQQLDCVAAQ